MQHNKWHPYPETKPTGWWKEYLVTKVNPNNNVTRVEIESWLGDNGDAIFSNDDENIIAWMEMPEPSVNYFVKGNKKV